MAAFISKQGLVNLTKYRYEAGLYGWLDRVVMTPFWDRVVLLLPRWLAPNAITASSLCLMLCGCLLMQYFSPHFTRPAPSWAYFLCAVIMFLYQTLDAVDGKQARRTQSATPLGQLFDHGCDAMTAVLSGCIICNALLTGQHSVALTFSVFCVHIVPFFVHNWEAAQTNHMRFGLIGVTEAQFLQIAIVVISGTWSPFVWQNTFAGIEARVLLDGFVWISTLWQCSESVITVRRFFREHPEAQAERSEAYWQLAQFLAFLALSSAYIFSGSPKLDSHTNIRAFVYLCGACFVHLTTQIIVCHVTKDKIDRWTTILYPFPFVVLNTYLRHIRGDVAVNEFLLLYVYATFACLLHMRYVVSVVREICGFLGISCFVIPVRPEPSKQKPS